MDERQLRAAYETARRAAFAAVRRVERAEAATTLARQNRTIAERKYVEAYTALCNAGVSV